MCGIIGVVSAGSIAGSIIHNCLQKLEYRGYDSWGLAVKTNGLEIHKKTGGIGHLPKKFFNATSGIGHTRWATHGKISVRNAHPHLSQNEKIAVVHNGIIENFEELKKFLSSKGFSFKTETDTEAIPMLIEHYMRKGFSFRESVRKTVNKLKGSYAIVAMHEKSNLLIGARHGSPLIAGMSKKNLLLSSDLPAIAGYANKVLFLEDSELIEAGKTARIFDIKTGRPLNKRFKKTKMRIYSAEKGMHSHYMLKEINEQGNAIKKAVIQPEKEFQKAINLLKKADNLFITGCGTSYHAVKMAAVFFAEFPRKISLPVLASEFSCISHAAGKKSVLIAVSQSGETADVLDAVKAAKKTGAKIIGITNVIGSSLTRMGNATLLMNSGPEISVLATKSYTAQLSLLFFIAQSLAGQKKHARKEIEKTATIAVKTIKESILPAKRLAKKLKKAQTILLIGHGENIATALEGALKIKEISYIHAEGFPAAELKHGSIALIEKGTPVIVVCSDAKDAALKNAIQARVRGAFIIGIGPERHSCFDSFIKVPGNGRFSILSIIPLQILAYYLAVEKGLSPDKPRNLAKSCTVR